MAREMIADNEFYTIEADTTVNRSYVVFRGFWPDKEEFKREYLTDVEKLLSRMSPGFTSLIDVRDFKIPPQSIMEAFIKAQELSKNKGVKKSATLTDQPIQTLASGRVGRESDTQMQSFNTLPEALQWLDEK